MLKTISYENINGRSASVEFPGDGKGVFTVSGDNGSGKTTLIDAVAFAFTGADSRGVAAPAHLISEGKEKLSIRVDTGRAVIERTMTRKKSQTLKLIRGEAPAVPLSQEDLTKMTCSRDAFLSGTVSGYFMTLPQEKASAVLREITESVDRQAVLEVILGHAIHEDYLPYLDLSKPSHTAGTKLTAARRDLTKELATLEGKLLVYKSAQPPGEKPQVPTSRPDALKGAKRLWESFRRNEAAIASAAAQTAAVAAKNAENEVDRKTLLDNLAVLDASVPPEPPLPSGAPQKELELQLKKLPQAPATMILPSKEVCPTCGQAVGLKHRESITALNEKLEAEYKAELEAILEHNRGIEQQIAAKAQEATEASQKHAEWRKKVADVNLEKRKIEAALSRILDHTPPAVPERTDPPTAQEPTDEELVAADKEHREWAAKHGEWAASAKIYDEAQRLAESASKSAEAMRVRIDQMGEIEDALAKLDEEVFKKTEHIYTMGDNLRLITQDGSITVKNEKTGLTYWQFSAGERIIADARIAEKIAVSLKKPIKFMFVDNYDLVNKSICRKFEVETVVLMSVAPTPLYVSAEVPA